MSSVSAVLLASGGDDLPPLTPARIISAWTVDPWLAAVVVAVGGVYLYGVSSLKRRGDAWPIGRTIAFVGGGLGTMALATMSSLGTYDDTLLSVHMIQHMLLSMIVPVFLCLGAPVTLALRTLPLAWRQRLVALLHSRFAKLFSFPLVTGILFVATPFVLYFSGWYEATLRNDYLHEVTHLHFILIGCLWFWPLLGIDPVPGRLAHPFRVLAIFATLPFHAILGLTIMQSTDLIAPSWYTGLHPEWGSSPLADQHAAGGILWGPGTWSGSSFSSCWRCSGRRLRSGRPCGRTGGSIGWRPRRLGQLRLRRLPPPWPSRLSRRRRLTSPVRVTPGPERSPPVSRAGQRFPTTVRDLPSRSSPENVLRVTSPP